MLGKEGVRKATREVAGGGINEELHSATAWVAGWEGYQRSLGQLGRARRTRVAKKGLSAGLRNPWRDGFLGRGQEKRPRRQREGT